MCSWVGLALMRRSRGTMSSRVDALMSGELIGAGKRLPTTGFFADIWADASMRSHLCM